MLETFIDDILNDAFLPHPHYFKRQRDDIRTSVKDDVLTISIDVPGVKKEAVDITFETGNIVKIVAKRADVDSTATWRYKIADQWDRDTADAAIEDGVLTITLSKGEREKSRKLLVK